MYRGIYISALLLFSLIFQACATQSIENNIVEKTNSGEIANKIIFVETSNNSSSEHNQEKPEKEKKNKVPEIEFRDISNSLGLIEITEKGFLKNETVHFYNQDGSLWNEFSLFDENKVYENIIQNKDFRPFRYDTDSNHFYFDWVGENKFFYKVIINEETKLKKFVKKEDSHFKADSWEKYILNCFAVEFDWEKNPLRKEINGQTLKENLDKSLTFQPEEIRGNWLKVKRLDNSNDEKKSKSGWIKWKDNNKILINFFETA